VEASDFKCESGLTASQTWNRSIENANKIYSEKMHNLLLQNCHHHVAHVLNGLQYKNRKSWGTVSLILFLMAKSSYVSPARFFKTWGVFFVICAVIIIIATSLSLFR
jgi:hypothetical protein